MADQTKQQPKKKNWIKIALISTAVMVGGYFVYKNRGTIASGFKSLSAPSSAPQGGYDRERNVGYSTDSRREYRHNNHNRVSNQQPKVSQPVAKN